MHSKSGKNLFIFIGGSDEQNGDYSMVHRLARRGGTAQWASTKTARPGDRVLIYIRQPHSALIAEAEVLADPVRGEPGDYDYRAKTGNFQLLPQRFTISDLKREFPRWGFLRYPRGKAQVPEIFANRLWKLVHEKQSRVQITISNSRHGQQLLEKMALSGRAAYWSMPKLTTAGDTVLFYVEHPVSAITATGKALTGTRATERKWFEAKVGEIQTLKSPITLAELRRMFPDWAWTRFMNMFCYVSPDRARALLERCRREVSETIVPNIRAGGAGFGDAKSNRLVEQAAVSKVKRWLGQRGFTVISRESERIGYDLDARKGRSEIHVEVKGTSGTGIQFPITAAEVKRSQADPAFRLMLVTNARTRQARVHQFSGKQVRRRFCFTPIGFMAIATGETNPPSMPNINSVQKLFP